MEFSGVIWQWRGPAPHHFVTVPPAECEVLKEVSSLTTYGIAMTATAAPLTAGS